MGAGYELISHQRGRGFENLGPDSVQLVAAVIAIAIAGCLAKVIIGNLMGPKRI